MDNLNEALSLRTKIDAVIQGNNQVNGNARNTRRDVSNAINNQILGSSTLTLDVYNNLSHRVESSEVHQAFIKPNSTGLYWDLTVYNDGSTDYYPYMFGKTLDHSVTGGFIRKTDGDLLIEAIKMNTSEKLQAIPQHASSIRKLEGVPVANSKKIEGKKPYSCAFSPFDIF